jgi:RNA polymerase sigma-70 factor (ECF subfamily)
MSGDRTSPDPDRSGGGAATITTTALLDSLMQEIDGPVWSEFDSRFRPIIRGVALRLGLSQEDASDVAQETLAAFVRDYRLGRYERGKGRLRTWVMAIARNRAIDLLRAQGRRRVSAGDSVLGQVPDQDAVDAAWVEEERRAVYSAALEQLRGSARISGSNLRAFELVALRGLTPEAVAAECGISVEQVYLAKLRMAERLKKIVSEITTAYEQDA